MRKSVCDSLFQIVDPESGRGGNRNDRRTFKRSALQIVSKDLGNELKIID